MARFINVWKESNIVISLKSEDDNSHWICEYEYMAAIETDNGGIVAIPLMDKSSFDYSTADECLEAMDDEKQEILLPYDCPARDGIIMDNITEWICSECDVSGTTPIEAVCFVVSLLTKHGMWKYCYSRSVDMKRIKEEYGRKLQNR